MNDIYAKGALYFFLLVGILVVLCGCSITREVGKEEDEFFVPLDTLRGGVVARKPAKVAEEKQKESQSPGLEFDWLQDEKVDTIPPYGATIESLNDSIDFVIEDIRLLQTFLEASTTDPKNFYHSRVKMWTIDNDVVRDSLFYALLAVDSSLASEFGAEAEVLATEENDLIQVRFGTAVFKGAILKDAIDKSKDRFLYQKIIQSRHYSKDIELRDTSFYIFTPFQPELFSSQMLIETFSPLTLRKNPEPYKVIVDASLYGVGFRIGHIWGGEVRLGNDEVGLPFWSSGKMSFFALYKRIKFGFEIPAPLGKDAVNIFSTFTVPKRLLSGTRGFAGEIDLGSFGGYLSFTKIFPDDISTFPNPNRIFYITSILHGYYSLGFSVGLDQFTRTKIGVLHYQVREGKTIPGGQSQQTFTDIHEEGRINYISPYLKFEYVNNSSDEQYGGSIQYNDLTILATAWLNIVPRIFGLELKYARPLIRERREWQNSSFVIVSPKFYLKF